MIRWALGAIFVATSAWGVDCYDLTYHETEYSICTADLGQDDIQLFHADDAGIPYGQFYNLRKALRDKNKDLKFAMNAGMFHSDGSPVGLFLENGRTTQRLITSDGPGNFGLLPNGVFCIGDHDLAVIETRLYAAHPPQCRFATQSGPMLVIDGNLHPRFIENGTSKNIRNGVGVFENTAIFAISNEPVNFYDFGLLFRDHFQVKNALYLDGNISRLFTSKPARHDLGWAIGPIVAVVADTKPATTKD